MAQGVSKEARGLGDEVAVKRLQLGPFGFAMRVEKLRPLRQPRRCERRQPADDRARQGSECRDIGRVQIALQAETVVVKRSSSRIQPRPTRI